MTTQDLSSELRVVPNVFGGRGMQQDITIINPLDDKSWDDRILAHPEATIFHTSAWARVLKGAFGYQPFYFCRSKGEKLSACLPIMEIQSAMVGRRGKTLPFTDYCAALVEDESQALGLLDHALDFGLSRRWKSYEMRGGTGMYESTRPCRTCYGHTIRLEDGANNAFAAFRSSTKRNIKRAIKSGIEVQHDNSLEALKTYRRLHCMTRKRQGHFTQPGVLFRWIHKEIIEKGRGFVSLALAGTQPIAGAIYFHANGRAIYAYGASNKSFQHLRPNNLLMWDAVQWYAERGYRELNLGVTDANNSGLRQYKNGMATTETVLNYYKYNFRQAEFIPEGTSFLNTLRFAVSKRMPGPVLNAAGNLLYRHHG